MKKRVKYVILTIMSLFLCNLQCLISNVFTAYAIPEDRIKIMICTDIEYMGAQRVEAHYDRKELRLIGIDNDGKQFIIARIKPKEDPFDGSGPITASGCDGNTISITIKQPFRTYEVTQIFKWDGKNLKQAETKTSDYSQDRIESAFDKVRKGNLEGAISDIDDVMYPDRYLYCDTIEGFLKVGHNTSLSLQKTEGFKRAATVLENTFELMVRAYNDGHYSGLSDPKTYEPIPKISAPIPNRWLELFKECEISASEYIPALNDYAFFLQESGQNDKAVNILLLVVSKAPRRTVAYLNLADAYWALNKKQTAVDNYRRYEKLMIGSGKADKIPSRVKERLKANP